MNLIIFYINVFGHEWWKNSQNIIYALSNPLSQAGMMYYRSFAIVLSIYALEFVIPWRRDQKKNRTGVWLDIVYTIVNFVLFWWVIGYALCETTSVVFNDFCLSTFGFNNILFIEINAGPNWLRLIALLLFQDFLSYWGHWCLHKSDFLWQFHKVHHSAQELDVLNANRLHVGEKLFYQLFGYLPAAAVGFDVQDVFYVALFIEVFSNFTHANIRIPFGPLRYVINSPQMHLWHHAVEVNYRRNVNYGDALSIWDYLFGTAYTPEYHPGVKLGFEGVEDYPTSYWGQFIAPFQWMSQQTQNVMRAFGFEPIDDSLNDES